jgi:S-adenosylmethionine:diacylglycerol 3-amino-3-carboxypropyl transferase
MKAQLHGILNTHIINAKRLGLQNVNDVYLKLILTMILAKLVTSTKATIIGLGIPIIQIKSK